MKLLKYSFLALALILGVSTAAHADPWWQHQAPEVDPGLAISGLTLLGGTLTVLRARRSK
jgi:hypothetical protein